MHGFDLTEQTIRQAQKTKSPLKQFNSGDSQMDTKLLPMARY